jgi:oligopeptide/dipeptide ABC transporter ATP-binding protein
MKLACVESTEKKKIALDGAEAMLEYLQSGSIDVKELKTKSDALVKLVEESINRLSLVKDSTAYTFKSAMGHAVAEYTEAMRLKNKSRLNKAEKVVFDNTDFELVLTNMIVCVTRLIEDYKPQLALNDTDFAEDAVNMIDYLKAQGAKMVFKVTKEMAKNRAIQLMEEVGIPEADKRYNQYPFEFSGGMRQRIVIAIALSANPDILICDEPTTALDVTIQSQILELINKLKEERQLSVIFITHDLGVVANMADKIAVMYAGKIVEYGTVDDIFYDPKHPYTWALLSSMPDIYTEERLEAIPGTPPDMTMPPVGDAFAARNKYALKIDYEKQPPMFKVSDTHYAATWLLHPDAPKVEPPRIVTARIERMNKLEAQSNE